MNEDLAALASAVDAARSARPDHPRLEFFIAQLERERERLANPGMPLRSTGTQAAPAPDPVSPRSATSSVQGLVLLANERMRSNQLVGGNDSAQAYLLSARRIDPADPGVQQGVAALASSLQSNARRAMSEGRLDEASEWVRQAIALDVDRPEVADLRSELEVARLGHVREDRARLFTLANQRIAQGRLVEPAADSARHYLDLLRASDPAYEGLSETSALLADKALAEARRLAAAGNVDGAEILLRAANNAGAPAADVAAAATEIAKARAALSPSMPVAPVVLPETALQRTYFVKPVYPPRALERGVTGWVDLEFTVARDGSTRDATVRGSEPMGVFDRAALESVARWRYEPRVVNGAVVDQRVAARVRFALKD
jgi:TonB family protein